MENIIWLGHSTIKLLGRKIIYIDPYNIKENFNDADIIFITHSHYDHFSKEDIRKCRKDNTKLVITEDLYNKALDLGFKNDDILIVLPEKDYELDGLSFHTVPAYNNNKEYHPKTKNWIGYIIDLNGLKYYIAGDTDITAESKKVKCDVAFLPVGGTYTTDYKEAIILANAIKPKLALPIHYGTLVGTKEDALKFKAGIDKNIKCEIMEIPV